MSEQKKTKKEIGNKFKYKVFIILLIIAMVGIILMFYQNPKVDPLLEEYKIYNVIIRDKFIIGNYVHDRIVIKEFTACERANDRESIEYFAKKVGNQVDTDTLKDFLAKNQRPYLLKKELFSIKSKCVFISESEMNELFISKTIKNYWNNFYRKYPNSQGIMELSKVGFNSRITQALVYQGNNKYSLYGSGYFILLTKKWGSWTIKYSIMVWIS